jgi:glutaminyl-peptide cyclotransferase
VSHHKKHAARGAGGASVLTAVTLVVSACLHAEQSGQAPAFDGARAFEHLRQIVAIGPRAAGSQGAELTRLYIAQQLSIIGLTAEEQPFVAQTPLGAVRMTNVRATIPGPGAGRLIIGGHYDTKLFREFTFVGANDGGSSTAFLLELARSLKGRANPMTIELLFLDGEESTGDWTGTDHTYGSQYYVDTARRAGTLKDLRAFILVDMIGDRDLLLKRESRSTAWLTDIIWDTAKQLKRTEFSDESTPIDDDHIPFLEAGVPAVDLIDLDYPDWHTPGDTIDKVSARSLGVVGEVLLAALPEIEKKLQK